MGGHMRVNIWSAAAVTLMILGLRPCCTANACHVPKSVNHLQLSDEPDVLYLLSCELLEIFP